MKTIWFATLTLGLMLILAPGRALAQRPLGIDVSSHEGAGIDWVGVRNSGVTFAWAKATEGVGYQDADFLINATNAQAAGVLLGAYHYARYDLNLGLSGATNEANWFWSVAGPFIKGNGGYLVPFLDVEQDTTNYTMTTLSQWVVAWCNVVSNNAYASGVVIRPMIYTYPSYASTYLNSTVTPFTLNMATVTPPQDPQTGAPSCSGPWGCNWTVWQYAWNNTVANINPCDVDTFNGTYSGMIGTLSPRNKHVIVDGYCGNDGNGIMQVFLPDAVNKIESVAQTCPNCVWGSWSSSGGPVCFGSPAVVGYNADLRMQIFVRGADNNLWTIWKTSLNGAWGAWNNYGGNIRGNVSVGYLPNGAMQLFVRSANNTVQTMYQTGPNFGWTAWSDLGGSCFADPTVGANGDGRMQLFIQTSTHTVQSNFKTGAGAWYGWVDYGGNCYGKPAVANLENGVMQVFTRTSLNAVQTIYQTSPNGTWGTWSSLGGDCVDDPVAGYNSDGRIELFTRTSLHTVSANYKTTLSPGSAWSGWNSLGGSCYSGLTVGYNADSRMQLFMRDSAYNLQSIWQTSPGGPWSTYLNMAGNTPSVLITTQPSSQSVTQGQTATFTVAANNALAYQWRFNAANISSATTNTYTITNAQPANAGGYSVVVTNAGGTAVSATANLAVVVPAFAMKNFQVKTNGTFHFEFSGTANQTYSLWTSTNLVQWQQIGFSTQDTPGQFEANDPAATNYSSRFYELRWP
jgi:GH25 family lysozyme M1 (1,4-beta-N-acetylmuramidase)